MATARDSFIAILSIVVALGAGCAPEADNRLTETEQDYLDSILRTAKSDAIHTASHYERAKDGFRPRLQKRLRAHLRGPVTEALLANWARVVKGVIENAEERGTMRALGYEVFDRNVSFGRLVEAAENDELTTRWSALSEKIEAAEEQAFQKEKADDRQLVVMWPRTEEAGLVLEDMTATLRARFPEYRWLMKGQPRAGGGAAIGVSLQLGSASYVSAGSRQVEAELVNNVRMTVTGEGLTGKLAEMFATPITASTKLSVPKSISSDALVGVETRAFQQGLDNLQLAGDIMTGAFNDEVKARAETLAEPAGAGSDASR